MKHEHRAGSLRCWDDPGAGPGHRPTGRRVPRASEMRRPMARKILVPVLPSDRFYEAVVRAGEVVSDEGGLITFAFTQTHPPQETYDDSDGHPSEIDVQ